MAKTMVMIMCIRMKAIKRQGGNKNLGWEMEDGKSYNTAFIIENWIINLKYWVSGRI